MIDENSRIELTGTADDQEDSILARILASSEASVTAAAAALRAGLLVAFPTETVYGLGAVATLDSAVESIYRAKRRPAFNPLIIHLAKLDQLGDIAIIDDLARRAVAAFWPGPLTVVLRSSPSSPVVARARGGLDSVAARMPADPLARALLLATGVPVAAPSANPSGRVSATTAAHVAEDLGSAVDLVLDGGPSRLGVESTVLDLRNSDRPRVLRPGAIASDIIAIELGVVLPYSADPGEISSPGQLANHYAPSKALRLEARHVERDEALLAFGPSIPDGAIKTSNLSPSGDLAEAAHNFFAMLRDLDKSPAIRIAAMPIPSIGLGIALNDRLRRAAAPRGSTQCG